MICRGPSIIAYSIASLLMCLLLSGSGCRRSHRADSARNAHRSASEDSRGQATRISQTVDEIAFECEVGRGGTVRRDSCKSSGLVDALSRLELGERPGTLLRDYCQHLSSANLEAKALVARRLALLTQRKLTNEVGDALYDCLAKQLSSKQTSQVWQHLAAAAVRVAVATGQTEDVLQRLAGHESRAARGAGYRALWPAGRLTVFGPVESLVRHGALPDRVAAVSGFAVASRLSAEEARAVCPLLSSLLPSSPDALVGQSAYALARCCPDAVSRLIAFIEQRLQREPLSVDFVRALSSAAGYFEHKARPEQLRRIETLLRRVSASPRNDGRTRAAARHTLARLVPSGVSARRAARTRKGANLP